MEEDTRNTGCLGVAVFAVLLVAGAAAFWQFFYEPVSLFIDARRWEKTPCVIIVSRFEPPATAAVRGEAPRGRIDIRYRYVFRGQHYRSSRIWFFKPRADDRDLLRRYPEGSSTWCYVNPRDPKEALLDRSFKPQLLIALVPLAMALIGLAGLLARMLRPRDADGQFDWQSRRRLQGAAPQRLRAVPGEQLVWRSPRGIGRFAFSVIFAGIWWSVVSFLVREVIRSWQGGVPDCHGLLLTVFAIPFVLAGVVLIGYVLVSFLKLFNPRVEVRLSANRVRLGDTVDVSWRFAGNAGRIERLEIWLEGSEQATYARGTSRITESEVFRKVNVASTAFAPEIRQGSARLTVPADAVPTFTAPNNRIVWELKIRGSIPRWPDVDVGFELTVLP